MSSMIRSLKVAEWPKPDNAVWLNACRPAVRLTPGGRAAHLKPVTRDDLARRFGQFLNFLERTNRLQLDTSALLQIQPNIVNEYITELSNRVSSVTVHGSIHKLRRAAEVLDPALNIDWLREIVLDLKEQARPAPKFHRLLSSNRIFDAGIKLMMKAGTETTRTKLQRARMARDGLLIAFLAICPIRLKNLASLRIGQHLVRDGNGWTLVLSNNETKSGRDDQRLIPPMLARWIDLFVEKYKPMFPQSGDVIWPSQYGGGMSYAGIQALVTTTTQKELGKPIGPHLFRHCVPYTIAAIDGSRMGLASSILLHTDPRTTEKYCHLGGSVESSKRFAGRISGLINDGIGKQSRESLGNPSTASQYTGKARRP